MFNEHDVVVVRESFVGTRRVAGTDAVVRPPYPGDLGAIVQVLGTGTYVVECVDPDSGVTLWLADFAESDLAAFPLAWEFSKREVSAGVYLAIALGPRGMRAEATDSDPNRALASCRAFAIRYPQ